MEYQIACKDGDRLTVDGSVLTIGKGKRAIKVLGLRGVINQYEVKSYNIDHVPTGLSIAAGYYFLSTARMVGKAIIEALGESLCTNDPETLRKLFSDTFKMYIQFYQYRDCKTPLSYEEWLNGPDYELARLEISNSIVSSSQEAQYPEELQDGDSSLAWIPDSQGSIDYEWLRCIIDGERHSSERVSALPKGGYIR